MPKKGNLSDQPCPVCREPCAFDAVICPNCHAVFTQPQIEERKRVEIAAKGERQQVEDKKNKKAAIGCVGLIAIVLLLAYCDGSDDDGGSANHPETSTSSGSTANPKADAIALYREVVSLTSGCDAASKQLAPALQSGNLVTAYRLADRAEDACLGAPSDIRGVDIPDSFDAKSKEDAQKALRACELTYLNKWSGAQALKKVIDGDARPSALAELEDMANTVQAGTLACAGGLLAVATANGASNADLGLAVD